MGDIHGKTNKIWKDFKTYKKSKYISVNLQGIIYNYSLDDYD